MKRYQNPDVYERLALEYSLGTMHGHARKRFEKLMQQHPFLQTVVEEYDHKFAELAVYLPEEKPSEHVWKNIEAQLDVEEGLQLERAVINNEKERWWHIFTTKSFIAATASFVLLVSLVFVNITQVPAYSCNLSAQNEQVMFTASVNKASMKLKVLPVSEIDVPKGKQMYFWCVPKNSSEAIMHLGSVSKTGMKMKLTPKNWEGIEGAHMFGISFETIGSKVTQPTDGLIYKGNIEPSRQT